MNMVGSAKQDGMVGSPRNVANKAPAADHKVDGKARRITIGGAAGLAGGSGTARRPNVVWR